MKRRELPAFIAAIERLRDSAPDAQAMECAYAYAEWKPDTEYAVGDRRRFGDLLYKCRQAHTSQGIYTPDMIPAIWAVISVEEGSAEHPISYSAGMALTEGLYYTEDGVLYICTRSTGVAVYNPLAALVGIYVNKILE